MADENSCQLLYQRERLPQNDSAWPVSAGMAHGDNAHETKAPRPESARADALEELDRLWPVLTARQLGPPGRA
jgi:hypothetical protein